MTMKAKHLLAIIAAAATSLAACQKTEDLGPEKVEIDSEASIEMPAEGGVFTVNLTATVDWALQGYASDVQEWLNISPESGKASSDAQAITVMVLENVGVERSANIVFYGNILCKAPLTITQKGAIDKGAKGSGTLADPYNAAAANAKCVEIGATASTEDYYVKGKISKISEVSVDFGNATFYISDGGTTNEDQFCVYRAYYLDGDKFTSADQIKVGDEVVVKGNLVNYRGNTPELNQGGQIVSINDSGDGGDGDESVAEPTAAVKLSIKEFLARPVNTTDWYELTGEIISIAGAEYGNITIKDETESVYVYGLVKSWANGKNDQSFASIGLKETDVVTIWTLRSEHNGTPQAGGNVPALYKSHKAGSGVTYPEGSVILKFPDDNSANNGISSYAKTWTAKIGSNEFAITNFNNNSWKNDWSYIKCGSKNGDSVASIFTATPIAVKLAKLQLTVDAYNAEYVNSLTFNVYSDAAKSVKVLSKTASDPKAGTIEFTIDTDKQATGLYYEVEFNCKKSSGNGTVQLSKVVYFAAE